jgi:hypothetical protein
MKRLLEQQSTSDLTREIAMYARPGAKSRPLCSIQRAKRLCPDSHGIGEAAIVTGNWVLEARARDIAVERLTLGAEYGD